MPPRPSDIYTRLPLMDEERVKPLRDIQGCDLNLRAIQEESAVCGDPDSSFKRSYQEVFNLESVPAARALRPRDCRPGSPHPLYFESSGQFADHLSV
jgi:hypothetical protein